MKAAPYASPLLLALALACASTDPGAALSLNVMHDLGSDIGAFRTWAWKPGMEHGTGDSRYDNEFIDACMCGAIEAELEQAGYERTAKGSADFLIEYRIDLREDPCEEAHFDPGDLSVFAWDTADDELAWFATLHGQITGVLPPEVRRRRIDDGVRRVLEEFTPLGRRTPPPDLRR